jgi:Tol biopolymer transport system component
VFTSNRSGSKKIWRMDIDGRNPTMLTPVAGAASSPRFSSDGQHVYFNWVREDSRVLGMVPLAGGEIVEAPHFSDSYWSVSNDGRLVAYTVYDEQERRSKLALRRIDEVNPFLILNIAPQNILFWTRDDSALIFREREAGDEPYSTVWIYDLASTERKKFLSTKPDEVIALSVSADGARTAVVRGRLFTDAVILTKIRE